MASRSTSNARNEIFDLLRRDHKKVKQAFRKFSDLDIEQDREQAQQLVTQTCAEIEVHADIEEELFYPAARQALKDTMVIAEAEVEHSGARMLIGELKELEPDDEAFAASFNVLGEYLKHHIREEENELFEQLERAKIDWGALRDSMLQRRTELMVEMGLAGHDEDAGQAAAMRDRGAQDSESGMRPASRAG